MKAVILAAGEGKRMSPLTLKTPKPLLKVNDKSIIDYVLESFPPEIDEVIIVVNYLSSKIKKHVGTKNRGRNIKYVKGSDKGSAYSFLACRNYLHNERFLLVHGDEIIHPKDVANCLKNYLSALTFKPKNTQVCGMVYLRKDGSIKKIIEKPKKTKSTLAIDGLMVLNTDVFNYPPKLVQGEFYLSTIISNFVRKHKVFSVTARGSVFDITTPIDLVRAGKIVATRYNKEN